jgi:type IV pilus assembly protein PilA
MAANEASAVGSVRTINTAEVTYNSTYNDGYAGSLLLLGGAAGATATCQNAELIDPILSGSNDSQKSGYSFIAGIGTIAVTNVPTGCTAAGYADGYTIIATPLNVGTTGQRSFCSDASGVIQYKSTGAAIAPAPPLCPAGLSALAN